MRGEGGEARAGEGGSGSQSVETSSIVNAFGCESRRKSEGYSLRLFTNFAYFFSDFLAFIASLCLFNLLCCTFPSPSSIFQCILFTFTCHLPHTCIQSSSISHQSLHIIAGSSSLCIWTNIVLYVSCLLCICLLVYRLHPLRLFFSMHHFGCRSFSFSLLLTPCHLAGLLSMTSASCLYWDFHCFLHEETIS